MYIVRHARVHFVVGHAPHQIVRPVEADVASFETLTKTWAKDREHVFFRADVVPGLRPADLRCDSGLIKTESDIYFDSHPMHFDPPVDVKSFRPIGGSFFRDDNTLYCVWYTWDELSCHRLDADMHSFEVLEGGFARDARGLFSHSQRVAGVDALTFQILHPHFARDEHRVYWLREGDKHTEAVSITPLKGADAESFEVFHPRYARDKNAVYFFDSCGGIAAARFLLKDCFRVETDRPANFVPLMEQDADPIVPDGYDGESLFLRGRRLALKPHQYRVRTNAGTHLDYVDIDRVSELVAASYSRFFPTETAPQTVEAASLGPITADGSYRAPSGTRTEERPPMDTEGSDDDGDIPF